MTDIVLDVEETKWIFVGGKGGVGKSTVSSTLAYCLAEKYSNEKILLISTDPAHNLSDIYNQPFSGKPKKVNNRSNLFVMEIDPTSQGDLSQDFTGFSQESTMNSLINTINQITNSTNHSSSQQSQNNDSNEDILSYIPGIDEAIAVVKVLEFAQSSEYKYLIFDTAPTGHTLRLLHLPIMLKKLVEKFLNWTNSSSSSGNIFQQISALISPDAGDKFTNLIEELETTRTKLEILVDLLKDKSKSQFICVIIPEQLSVYENERLMQKLDKDGITFVRNIVINRVDFDCSSNTESSQFKKISKNIELIEELYGINDGDFSCKTHYIPIVPFEIRGIDKLNDFKKYLTTDSFSNNIKSRFLKNNTNGTT